MKNQLIENSDNFVNDLGKGAETIGQVPRNLVNSALGTDSSTAEKTKNNADNIDESEENIEQLEQYLEEIYAELLQELSLVNEEIDSFKLQVSSENQQLQDIIDDIHSELLDEINRVDRKNIRKIRRLKSKLRQLKRDVRELENYIDDLETYCYSYLQVGHGFPRVRTYCEIYSDNEEFEDED